MNNKEGHRKRLKTKYLKVSKKTFLDYEIVELLLTYSIPRKDCKDIAKELLKRFKSIAGVLNAEKEQILNIEGIGENSYILLKLVNEINDIYFRTKVEEKEMITGIEDLVKYLRVNLAHKNNEVFKVIFLDSKNTIIDFEDIANGTIDKAEIYPRELVKKVLNYNAKSLIFSHNHPSGNLEPSKSDIDFTLKMKNLLKEIEVNLFDHVIISKKGHYSFLENNLI